jgi:hypothetical protein
MDKEVDPKVLAVIDEKRLSGPRLSPVEIVAKMGVFDAREKPFEHAWLATGDNVIATVWAEFVSIGSDGHWFYLESLDTERRPGGGTRSANQVQRAKDRLGLLKRTFDAGTGFRAVLQTNRVAIAELESNRSAKVSTRVRDDDEWHVASWDPEQEIAVLVRGARGWAPTEAELNAARAKGSVPPAEPPPDAATLSASPEQVQIAAMGYVSRHFNGYGYKAEDVSSQKLGYDFEVLDKKGTTLLKVCVKGIAAARPHFQIDPTERAASTREPLWRLLVVSDALNPAPQHKIYKPSEIEQAYGFKPLA